jgi:type IV pilus assembly protein PilW
LGFTLIELMVAMLLGLIVIAGVASVFLANLRSYHSNVALSDVQSNARIAFELIARDIRQAGLTGCNTRSGRVANVLNNGPNNGVVPAWWADWNSNALRGYVYDEPDPAVGNGARVDGADSLIVLAVEDVGASIHTANAAAGTFTLNEANSNLRAGDIAVACNPDHAAIFQIADYDSGSLTVTYKSSGTSPGNCSKGLGFRTDCTSSTGNPYQFTQNATLARFSAHDWYVGKNPVGGTSLYRVTLVNRSGAIETEAQEMVRNVRSIKFSYHLPGEVKYRRADGINAADWGLVDAVRVTATLTGAGQRAGTDNQPLERSFTATTTIRNRVN